MKKAIIIPSHPNFNEWLLNCLKTLKGCSYPIVIIHNTDDNNEFEMKAVKTGMEYFEDFIVLQDTIEVKNLSVFDVMFNFEGTVFYNPYGQMFINKYNTCQLKTLNLPKVNDKLSAVNAEITLHKDLLKFNPVIINKNFVDGDKRENKMGRLNMVIEDDHFKKYKGTWSLEMVR